MCIRQTASEIGSGILYQLKCPYSLKVKPYMDSITSISRSHVLVSHK